MNSPYSPRPWHLVLPVALFALGARAFDSGGAWYLVAVGVMLWILAWVVVVWIVLASMAEHKSRYYDSVSSALDSANRCDIEKIASLGFTQKEIKNRVSVELHDKTDGANTTRYFELPVSAPRLVPLARAVIEGQPFSERRWTGAGGLLSADEFRRLRGVMREKGLIEPVSEKDPRQGYKLTESGLGVFKALAA